MSSMKRQNDRILKEELPRSVCVQYATGNHWRKNSRKNEGMEPKQKQYPVVDGTGNRSKVQCCKEQYCIGTWNVRAMNQGKLEPFTLVSTKMKYLDLNQITTYYITMVEFLALWLSLGSICRKPQQKIKNRETHYICIFILAPIITLILEMTVFYSFSTGVSQFSS